MAAILAVVIPAIVFGPWLPLPDLVSFVGLDTFPAERSFGPLHFVPLQFTYVLHLLGSRGLSALGVPTGAQIVIFYLLQAVTFVVVLWRLLAAVLPNAWAASCALSLGALAFWEGQFLWGGPLPCSLAAALLSVALLLTLLESGRPVTGAGWLVPLLAFASLVSHPFALPFALVLLAVRLVLVPERRWQSAATAVAVGVFGIVIARDSPGGLAAGENLRQALFSFELSRPWKRLNELFIVDGWTVRYVFGEVPRALQGYLVVLAAVRLTGFVLSPLVAILARDRPVLRALAMVNTVAASVYFFTPGLEAVLPWWPQRVLAFYGPFTYAAAVGGAWYLAERANLPVAPERLRASRLRWALPCLALIAVVWVQVPLLRLGSEVRRNFEQVRREVLDSGVRNALLMTADLQTVQPRYLRCVSFLLFSDPQLLGRNLLLFTEWHMQDRHPTRLVERWFELGRRQYHAVFSSDRSGVHVKLVPLPPGEIAPPANNNEIGPVALADGEARIGDSLLGEAHLRDAAAHYRAALRLQPDRADMHNSLAVTLIAAGDWSGAIEHLETALRAKPEYAAAQANLGYALLRAGRAAEAVPRFREALRLNPTNQLARDGLRLAGAHP